jgi:hypothetical protein
MKKLLVLIGLAIVLGGGFAIANLAFAHTTVRTHTISAQVRAIVVTSGSGDVDVVDGGGQVAVRETQHYLLTDPSYDQSLEHGVLTIKTGCDSIGFTCHTDLRLAVPAGVKVTVDAGSGDVDAHGTALGAPHLHSDSGDISVDVGGRMALVWAQTDSGDVDVDAAAASAIDAQSDSGDVKIDAGGPPRRIVGHSDSGSVKITVPAGDYAIDAQTDSGDIGIDHAITRDDRATHMIDAQTDSGDVKLRAR